MALTGNHHLGDSGHLADHNLIDQQLGAISGSYQPLPSGTPVAGQVPVATGSGNASAWGYVAGMPANPVSRTTAYTAAAGDFVEADTSSAGFTVTLPTNPAAGALVAVKKVSSDSNTLTISPAGGGSIDGSSTATTITQWAGAVFEHKGSNVWRVVASMSTTGPTGPTGLGFGSVVAKTTSYTILTGDNGSVLTFTGTGLTASLPASAPASPWMVTVINLGSGTLTVAPNGRTLNGSSSSLTVAVGQSVFIWSDGSNYQYGTGPQGATGNTGAAGFSEWWDTPRTFPFGGVQETKSSMNSRTYAARVFGSGTITKIRIIVGVQSGNICINVFGNTGSGASAQPGTLKGTTGSIACPASGAADVSLTGSVTVADGDWFAITADNNTATFSVAGSGGVLTIFAGESGFAAVNTVPIGSSLTLSSYESKVYLMKGLP